MTNDSAGDADPVPGPDGWSADDPAGVTDTDRVWVGDYVQVDLPFESFEGQVVHAGDQSVGVEVYEGGAPTGEVVGVMREHADLHAEGREVADPE